LLLCNVAVAVAAAAVVVVLTRASLFSLSESSLGGSGPPVAVVEEMAVDWRPSTVDVLAAAVAVDVAVAVATSNASAAVAV